MNANDIKKNANDPSENPASQPHGTTQDQVNEMESEGQATKQGQSPNPSPPGTQARNVSSFSRAVESTVPSHHAARQ